MLQSIPILTQGTGLIKEHLAPWFSSWSYMMELMFVYKCSFPISNLSYYSSGHRQIQSNNLNYHETEVKMCGDLTFGWENII